MLTLQNRRKIQAKSLQSCIYRDTGRKGGMGRTGRFGLVWFFPFSWELVSGKERWIERMVSWGMHSPLKYCTLSMRECKGCSGNKRIWETCKEVNDWAAGIPKQQQQCCPWEMEKQTVILTPKKLMKYWLQKQVGLCRWLGFYGVRRGGGRVVVQKILDICESFTG